MKFRFWKKKEETKKLIVPTLSYTDIGYWLTDWCNEVGLNPKTVTYTIDNKNRIVFIFTSHPGPMIGKAGIYASKYKDKLTEMVNKHNEIFKKYGRNEMMEPYDYQFIEVTEADYWVNYMWDGM